MLRPTDDPVSPTNQVSLPAADFEPYAEAVITITNLAAAVHDAVHARTREIGLEAWAGSDRLASVVRFLATLPAPVSVKFAAARLELSEPALREWIRRGLIRTESDRLRRVRIPFTELVALSQRTTRLRDAHPGARLLPLIDAELATRQLGDAPDVLDALRAVSAKTSITIAGKVTEARRRDIEASVARRRARLRDQLADAAVGSATTAATTPAPQRRSGPSPSRAPHR